MSRLIRKSIAAGVPEATLATFGFVEDLHCNQFGLLVASYHHLSYAFSVVNNKRFVAQVNHNHAYFTSVISIDGARRIQQRYAMLERQTAAGTYLCLEPHGQCHAQSGWYEPTL